MAQNLGQLLYCFSAKLSQFLVGVAAAEAAEQGKIIQWCCCQSCMMSRPAASEFVTCAGNNLWMFDGFIALLKNISKRALYSRQNLGALRLKGVFPRQCDNLIRNHWIRLLRSCSASVYPVEQVSRIDGWKVTSGQPVAPPQIEPVLRLKNHVACGWSKKYSP